MNIQKIREKDLKFQIKTKYIYNEPSVKGTATARNGGVATMTNKPDTLSGATATISGGAISTNVGAHSSPVEIMKAKKSAFVQVAVFCSKATRDGPDIRFSIRHRAGFGHFSAIRYPAGYWISKSGYRISGKPDTGNPANLIFSNTFFSYLKN